MSQEVVILYIVFYYCWCMYHCYYFVLRGENLCRL